MKVTSNNSLINYADAHFSDIGTDTVNPFVTSGTYTVYSRI